MFTVYTYFGRTISTHKIEGLHHAALEQARQALRTYEATTSNPAWIKYT